MPIRERHRWRQHRLQQRPTPMPTTSIKRSFFPRTILRPALASTRRQNQVGTFSPERHGPFASYNPRFMISCAQSVSANLPIGIDEILYVGIACQASRLAGRKTAAVSFSSHSKLAVPLENTVSVTSPNNRWRECGHESLRQPVKLASSRFLGFFSSGALALNLHAAADGGVLHGAFVLAPSSSTSSSSSPSSRRQSTPTTETASDQRAFPSSSPFSQSFSSRPNAEHGAFGPARPRQRERLGGVIAIARPA